MRRGLIPFMVTWVSLSGFLSSCSGDDKAFKGGTNEAKPLSRVVEKASLNAEGPDIVGTFNFAISVMTNSGARFSGSGDLQIMSDFSLVAKSTKVTLGSMVLDMTGLINRISSSFLENQTQGNFTKEDGILYVRDLGPASFDPPRPLLLGPLIVKPERYRGLKKTTQHDVTIQSGSTKKSASGSLTVEVLETAGSFTSANGKSFDHVLHWVLSSHGFSGVPATKGFLFDRVEWWFNTKPLMIPKIAITGNLGELMTGKGDDVIKDLIGTVTVTIEVLDYNL